AGVLAFCYLTNNYGYTGDWFVGDIKDLQPSPVLYWFKDCFAPQNVFINLPDGRYIKDAVAYNPGESLSFTLYGVNDLMQKTKGTVKIEVLDSEGRKVFTDHLNLELPAADRVEVPYQLVLPKTEGGYLLQTSFKAEGSKDKKWSRRYFKVGKGTAYSFCEVPVQQKSF
ncbi:MAG: hypothetical protein ICV66_08875, partial [Chitinophagaceae bacterium]|nr:hypothetical protein [Chitinophagaceae bacterium]